MKTLIIYDSKHGNTEDCARQLAGKLAGETALCNLKSGQVPGLEGYDQIIIGSPIYMGQSSKRVKAFCEAHGEALLEKPLGLFVCGMADGEAVAMELQSAYSSQLSSHALALEFFGGVFNFKRMNPFEKFIIKMVNRSQGAEPLEKNAAGSAVEKIRTDAIDQFAKRLNERDRT